MDSLNRSKIMLGGLIGIVVLVFFIGTQMFLPSIVAQDPIDSKPILTTTRDEPLLAHEAQSLIQIFEATEKGVVSITVQRPTVTLGSRGLGSGFVYDNEGHIITNDHVVNNAEKITVTFIDGKKYNAKVVGKDHFSDIAVLQVDAEPESLHPLPIGDSSKLKVGEQVAAIGNPFGLTGTMTSGIVSALGRLLPNQGTVFSISDVIQTDAAINPGNSGGPLLNMQGQVIGINTAIISNIGEFTGVGFSIPSNTISKIVPIIIKEGEYKHPWIGITGSDIDQTLAKILDLDDAKGFLIKTVVKDSPADKAGLRGSSQTKLVDDVEYLVGGDIIISIDGKEVRKIDDIFTHLQNEKSPGDKMNVKVLRDGKIKNLEILLESRPDLMN